jgi:hypothetical protein
MEIKWIPEDMHFAVLDDKGNVITRCIDRDQAESILKNIESNIYKESSDE